MKYSLSSAEARELDRIYTEKIGIPSVVLMEKAAMGIVCAVTAIAKPEHPIICACGYGNNGGDAVAAARMLKALGYSVKLHMVGDRAKATKEIKLQLKIAKNLGIEMIKKVDYSEYSVIIDGIFGIGLSRIVTGDFYKEIEEINAAKARVISVDIPSGVCADDGRIFGIAVKADLTVTFGFNKTGCLLYPGAEYVGKVVMWDMGTSISQLECPPKNFFYDEDPKLLLPARKINSNKGSYGKVLVIAGSENMAGAAYFSAAAAYRMGAGVVRILTHEGNREILQKQLPEAVLSTYRLDSDGQIVSEDIETIKASIGWANVIALGPGIGENKASASLVNFTISECKVPLVIDADGINIISKLLTEKTGDGTPEERVKALTRILPPGTVLTPHKKELSRLIGVPLSELMHRLLSASIDCTKDNDLIFVKKDVHSIVSFGESNYINVTGNDGMATAGSGDVLTGIIAGLIAQGDSPKFAAMTGCYIHGFCGTVAAEEKGARSMLASDMLDAIPKVIYKKTIKKEIK